MILLASTLSANVLDTLRDFMALGCLYITVALTMWMIMLIIACLLERG